MKILLCILFINCLLCSNETFSYDIKYFGIKAADCYISKTDTIYDNKRLKKIVFKIQTNKLFSLFYPVKNLYTIIIDDKNNILFFEKNTSQPRIINKLITEIKNDKVFYKNTDFEIKKGYYNIFSFLIILMNNEEITTDFTLEREGVLYDAHITKTGIEDEIILLELQNIDNSNSLIKHTDIFTWAIFMDNAHRQIILSKKYNRIQKCIFKKGLTKLTAEYIERK